MKNNELDRRAFLKGAIGTGLLVAGSGLLPSCSMFRVAGTASPAYDAKGLPTAVLGKTGVRIPRIALGLGSRFCSIENGNEAHSMLNYALDNGLYYWDTAWAYDNKALDIISEERVGEVVKSRRDEIFLSTKVTSRDPDEAMRQIEASLKRLQTDHLDLLKIHSVGTEADVATLKEKGNLIDILVKLKSEGICRFIGYSGHSDAEAMKMMAETGAFDSMLIAMNHYGIANNSQKRQELAIPAAKKQGMGVMLMKVVRPRETVKELKPEDLIKYALSLNGPDGIVLGVDSLEVVKSNLEILRSFRPMEEQKMKDMAQQLAPFQNQNNLEWMNPSYQDGNWA